jgi:hypothetical protein
MNAAACRICNRRMFLGGLALGTAAFYAPGVFAEELVKTPGSATTMGRICIRERATRARRTRIFRALGGL